MKRLRGSMLVEAMVALTVLTVVAAGYTSLTANKALLLEDARARSLATRAADGEIARLRASDFDTLSKQNNRSEAVAGLPGGRLRVQVKAAEHGLKEVRVGVTWTLRSGAEETLVCYALIGPGAE